MIEENEKDERSESLPSANGDGIRTVTVIGQIEGHYLLSDAQKTTKYEHMLPFLSETELDPRVKGVLILINTMGGDVEAGLAIAELIAGMSKPTASVVLGGGHSIGVPLAVAAKRSFIVPSATMTLHPVRMNGTVIGVPQTYRYLERMQDRIIGFVTSHSRIERERLRALMLQTDELANDTGTVIDGKEAVDVGLIDRIGGLSDAISWLRGEIGGDDRNDHLPQSRT